MKKIFNEFKAFISRGNVVDLAVGMIVGSAFTSIVNSLVNDVVMPLISILTGGLDFTAWNIVIGSGENAPTVYLGNFIAEIVNFLIVAAVIFAVVKALNTMHEMAKKPEEPAEPEAPTVKTCPYCLSEIKIEARRCAFCTSLLDGNALLEESE